MLNLIHALYRDDAGFIVSSELVLVTTLGVIAMVVGLSEVAYNVSEELEDSGSAVGQINQSYHVASTHGHKACVFGSNFKDQSDFCDTEFDINCDSNIRGESHNKY